MYDRQNEYFHKRVLEIKEYIYSNYKNNIKIFDEIQLNKKFDLYVILSDNIIEIKKHINSIRDKLNLKNKEKNKNKLVIITKNKQIDHIIKCVNITKNMYYLYSSNEYLINKFNTVYESNIAKYN